MVEVFGKAVWPDNHFYLSEGKLWFFLRAFSILIPVSLPLCVRRDREQSNTRWNKRRSLNKYVYLPQCRLFQHQVVNYEYSKKRKKEKKEGEIGQHPENKHKLVSAALEL